MKLFAQKHFDPAGWISGFGLGACLGYLFDPDSGPRRRGLVHQKAIRLLHVTTEGARRSAMDFENRARGLLARIQQEETHEATDEILVARVRSRLGRLVSHPRAIDVAVKDGTVTLSGPVLKREADRLLRRTRQIPGVKAVEENLERHESPERVPALQGGRTRLERAEILQENWTPAVRVLAGVAGASLLGQGLKARTPLGTVTLAFGGGLLARAVTNLPTRRLFGIGAGRRAIDIQKDLHINAPVEEVFVFFANFENFPKFMSHLRSVEIREGHSRWTAVGPAGLPVHWDAEVTRLVPNQLLAWKSLPHSEVQNAGIARFEGDPRGGTHLEIHMSYNPPAGAIGHAFAKLFGADPKKAMDDDLIRLKSLIEDGKARAHGHTIHKEDVAPHPEPGMQLPESERYRS